MKSPATPCSSTTTMAARSPATAGFYIGGDKFIEYFSHGRPARVSHCSEASDYMGCPPVDQDQAAQRSGGVARHRRRRPTHRPSDQAKEADARALFKTPGGLSSATRSPPPTARRARPTTSARSATRRSSSRTRSRPRSAAPCTAPRSSRRSARCRTASGPRRRHRRRRAKTSELLPRAIRETDRRRRGDAQEHEGRRRRVAEGARLPDPVAEDGEADVGEVHRGAAGDQRRPPAARRPAEAAEGRRRPRPAEAPHRPLESAEGTKGLQDDLKALRAIQTFLTGALRGSKGEKRLSILDELNSVKSQIGGIVRDILDKAQTEIGKRRTVARRRVREGRRQPALVVRRQDVAARRPSTQQFDQLTPAEQALLGIQNRERGFERADLVADVDEGAEAPRPRDRPAPVDKAQRDLQQAQDALAVRPRAVAQAERDARRSAGTAALDALEKQRADERQALEDKIAEFQKMLETGGSNMGSAFAKGLLARVPGVQESRRRVPRVPARQRAHRHAGQRARRSRRTRRCRPGDRDGDPIAGRRRKLGRTRPANYQPAASHRRCNVPVVIASDMVEAQAKYNRRNGRQTQ
jgi:hypothetical protein